MAEWIIEQFKKDHDQSTFECGKASLDDFIGTRVNQYEKRHLGKTFVAVRAGENRVTGYYTLAAGAIAFENRPPGASRKLPQHPVPVVLLARLAVDQSAKGTRLVEVLLLDALQRTRDLSKSLGIHAIKVDALDDSAAAAFYRKYGFTPLMNDLRHLYLPMKTIEEVLA